jgi:hypothetical protein
LRREELWGGLGVRDEFWILGERMKAPGGLFCMDKGIRLQESAPGGTFSQG